VLTGLFASLVDTREMEALALTVARTLGGTNDQCRRSGVAFGRDERLREV
jgi:hypothetical protein